MKRGMMPLNALRAFEATMRHGQMKLAADELGVTYGAVSRQVRGLEATLGVPLFEGPRSGLVPTDTAVELQRGLQEAFDRMERAVAEATGRHRRQLDVSCLGTLSMRWLIPRLLGFQKEHGGIEVRMTADDGPVDFARRGLDVAIRVGVDGWGNAAVTLLFPDEVGPVLSPRLIGESAKLQWKDLAALPRLHTKTRPSAWADWCNQNSVGHAGGGQQFEHFYFMLEAATAGLGVAIAPRVLVQDDLNAGRLVAPFGFRPSGQHYVALTRQDPSRDALLFVDWLGRQAADQ